jgi:hypothetical protein
MLWHTTHTNWFKFHAGSRLVHLRFPIQYRTMARDGVLVWFEKPGPATCEAQPLIADPALHAKAKEKIIKVVRRRYLVTTDLNIKSPIKYFAVPKGEDDVRMVYDAAANRLKDCVWVPIFWLPTINLLVRALDENLWMTDRDVGDKLLNFQLHRTAIPFIGVDQSLLYESDADAGPRWAVWDRNLMGFVSSPYNSLKMALVAEEICRGDRHEQGLGSDGKELNPLMWERICLNLPGSKDYEPTKSWISKIRADGRVACDLFTFVADEQVTGPDEDLTWQASHALASNLKAELSWHPGRGTKSTTKQQDTRGVGRGDCSCALHVGSMCSHLNRKMDQDEGYFGEVAEANLRPNDTKALAQGTPLQSWISCIRHKDLSHHDPMFEGIPPQH